MPSSKFLIGPGKVEALAQCVATEQIDVALFDCALSGAQERNLEHSLGCRVLDRTGLILVIFALRARSHEGKLQVELAQLEHMSTRLVRGWSHLDRQKGGIGLRGAGEKQLELDQRMLRARMRSIRSRLDQVRKQRAQGRRSRARAELPTLSLVGYTNSGKSTLFNRLTQAGVYAADQLFATLDSTLRRVEWPELGPAVLADTVGFIRDLPHQLVDAFHATLEETQAADLLLQVVDASDPDHDTHHLEVEAVLAEIGACDRPRLWVYNKIDALSDSRPRSVPGVDLRTRGVWHRPPAAGDHRTAGARPDRHPLVHLPCPWATARQAVRQRGRGRRRHRCRRTVCAAPARLGP